MRYQKLGDSGITASVVTLGAMEAGGGFRYPKVTDDEAVRAIQTALDAGITFIDTAPVYGFGHSEEVVARAIRGRRDKVVLSTKCGLWWDDDEGTYRFTWDGHRVKRNVSARVIKIEIEKSLKRLQTDYIDVYYTHDPALPPFDTPLEETVGAMNDLLREGKIRAIGASNVVLDDVRGYVAGGSISLVQNKFNLLERGALKDVIPYCQEHHIQFHGYSTLEAGLLAGKVARDLDASGDPAKTSPLWRQPNLARAVDLVEGLRSDVAAPLGIGAVELAIAYSIAKGVNPICGIYRPDQVAAVARAADVELSDADVAEIDRRVDEFWAGADDVAVA